MKIKMKKAAGLDLLIALLINLLFLAVVLSVYSPYFETNDDFVLMQMSNGAYGNNEHRLVYINIVLGSLFRFLYSLIPGVQWYTVIQYLLLLCSFTSICWVMLRRWRLFPALAASLSMFFFFALDAYVCIQYTKTASVLTCAGLFVMYHATEYKEKTTQIILLIGGALALAGLMYRYLQFFACGIICCFIALDILLARFHEAKIHGKNFCQYVLPFVLLLSFSLMLTAVDKLAYREDGWSEYLRFNKNRTDVMDYGALPPYEDAMEICKTYGITESLYNIIKSWDFIEPELLLDGGGMEALSEYCNELREQKTIPLFKTAFAHIAEILHYLPCLGLISAGLLWLLFGRHEKNVWIVLLLSGFAFLINVCLLVAMGRYNMYRVDYSLLFALYIVVLWFLPNGGSKKRADAAALVTLLLTITICLVYLPGWNGKFMKGKQASYPAHVQLVDEIRDNDALYIADCAFFDSYMHDSPFARNSQVTAENILPLGGWQAMYPPLMEQYASYGVRNPFKDCVNRDDVLLLTRHIELSLTHIRETYFPSAQAEIVIAPSNELPFGIYRIIAE